MIVLVAHRHITIDRGRAGDCINFVSLFVFLLLILGCKQVALGAHRFLIIRHKKLNGCLSRAKIEAVELHFVLGSLIVFAAGLACGTAHHEISGWYQDHVERYLFAVLGCNCVAKFLLLPILCCRQTWDHHDAQTNHHNTNEDKLTILKHILFP